VFLPSAFRLPPSPPATSRPFDRHSDTATDTPHSLRYSSTPVLLLLTSPSHRLASHHTTSPRILKAPALHLLLSSSATETELDRDTSPPPSPSWCTTHHLSAAAHLRLPTTLAPLPSTNASTNQKELCHRPGTATTALGRNERASLPFLASRPRTIIIVLTTPTNPRRSARKSRRMDPHRPYTPQLVWRETPTSTTTPAPHQADHRPSQTRADLPSP
jgi:hypothetical protein